MIVTSFFGALDAVRFHANPAVLLDTIVNYIEFMAIYHDVCAYLLFQLFFLVQLLNYKIAVVV